MSTISFPFLDRDEWARESHTALWGKPDAHSRMLNGIKCLHESLEPRASPRNSIIIRDEYSLLWDEIEEQSTSIPRGHVFTRGLVVWGHPGIGKTLFLRYAVARALEKSKPFFLCEQSEYCLYFDESGVQRVVFGHINTRIKIHPRILAFFDTNDSMPSPLPEFLDNSFPAFVVQVTTPQWRRWYKWAKRLEARKWFMMPWSREEIYQLDVLRPTLPNHYTAVEICEHLGPNPRHCLKHIPKSLGPLAEHDFGLPPFPLDNPDQLLRQIQFGSIEDEKFCAHFHQYFYAYRQPGEKSLGSHQFPCCGRDYRVPTQFLLRTLIQAIAKETLVKQQEIWDILSPLNLINELENEFPTLA